MEEAGEQSHWEQFIPPENMWQLISKLDQFQPHPYNESTCHITYAHPSSSPPFIHHALKPLKSDIIVTEGPECPDRDSKLNYVALPPTATRVSGFPSFSMQASLQTPTTAAFYRAGDVILSVFSVTSVLGRFRQPGPSGTSGACNDYNPAAAGEIVSASVDVQLADVKISDSSMVQTFSVQYQDCQQLNTQAYAFLRGSSTPEFVAMTRGAQMASDWTRVVVSDCAPQQGNQSCATGCWIPTSMSYQLLWAQRGLVSHPQNQITGVKVTFSCETLQCSSKPHLTVDVTFVETTVYPEAPRGRPTLDWKLPFDFFYPFRMAALTNQAAGLLRFGFGGMLTIVMSQVLL
ncbi:TECT3 protein, partial [Polypterus senegalus]